ncbi:hypothetical protein [Paenibacillus campinasensis]|uniref:Uncharacterized protein n=1 Tax=Paenibacillus campinasensis TaxID=66347 RepID=A0A268EIA4_9BACL|nr:hypothetical protein [Paenibacillus campinasensis]PAD72846.1 hypothetical protein CHH67_21300 [Paenibacillus campinasensis]
MSQSGWILYDSNIGYYVGKDYIDHGEKFPGSGAKPEAKVYRTKKIAEKVAERLARQMYCDFNVVPLDKEGGYE